MRWDNTDYKELMYFASYMEALVNIYDWETTIVFTRLRGQLWVHKTSVTLPLYIEGLLSGQESEK